MIERRIKELSIALEALSRIHSASDEYAAVNGLLISAIDEAHKEANPQVYIKPTSEANNLHDEIPF